MHPGQEHSQSSQSKVSEPTQPGRREFLGRVGLATVGAVAASVFPSATPVAAQDDTVAVVPGEDFAVNEIGPLTGKARANKAYDIRKDAAKAMKKLALPSPKNNGDEDKYPNRIGNYSKAMPHNQLGEVDGAAYTAYLKALSSGKAADFDAVPLGGTLKFENPQCGLAFEMAGFDPHHVVLPAAPTFDSAETAGEMVELYWQALTRDVPFARYDTDPLTNMAADELSKLSAFKGPKDGGRVTTQTLFRGTTAGDTTGPYISQFLLKGFQYGAIPMTQKIRVPQAGLDYMTDYDEWLNVQNGKVGRRDAYQATTRHIINGRDIGEYVHNDPLYQSIYHAALILLGMGAARDAANPYLKLKTTQPFATFGGPFVLGLLATVMTKALEAQWYNKWYVHRRLRPEEYGGRVHNHITKKAVYPLHPEVLNSKAAEMVFAMHGTYLLPMAFPEGCPTHPSYGAGHAAFSAAGVTVLKAFFDESFVVKDPVVPNEDGSALVPYTGPDLTVGGELNKLAANIAIPRNTAGVHWRTDAAGIVGEEIAVGYMREMTQSKVFVEDFTGFSLTRFDGTKITV